MELNHAYVSTVYVVRENVTVWVLENINTYSMEGYKKLRKSGDLNSQNMYWKCDGMIRHTKQI